MNGRFYGNNIAGKIASVVFAVILWFHVTSNESYSGKYTLPIQYVGPSEGHILASDKPDNATVVISGTGKDLLLFYLLGLMRSEKRYALVNMTGLPQGANTLTLEKSMVHLGLVSGLDIESILYPNNASFTVEIDKLVKRTVAVNTDSLPGFKVADGFTVVGKPASKPAFVMAQGPQNVVDNIGAVRVGSMKKRTISPSDSIVSAALRIPRYVSVEPQEVSLHFSVESDVIRELTGIRLTLNGFPRQNRPRFQPDSLSVTFRGPKSFVSSLKPADVVLAVDYKHYLDIKNRGETTITPSATLPEMYEGVDVVDISPRAVRFEVTP